MQATRKSPFRSLFRWLAHLAAGVAGLAPAFAQGAPQVRWVSAGHSKEINVVAFSPDGSMLASASDDHTIKLWRPADGAFLRTLAGHTRDVHSVAFTPDGALVVSGSDDNTIRIWNATNGAQVRKIGMTLSTRLHAVALSPDGQFTAAAVSFVNSSSSPPQDRPAVFIHRVDDGTLVKTWRRQFRSPGALAVAFSPDGARLAAGIGTDVFLWDVATEMVTAFLPGQGTTARSVAFSPAGELLAVTDESRFIQMWSIPPAPAPPTALLPLAGHQARVRTVAFSKDGGLLASASFDRSIHVREMTNGAIIQVFFDRDEARTVAFSPDGATVASGNKSDDMRLWDVVTGTEVRQFTQNRGDIRKLRFSLDGRLFAALSHGSEDRTVKLWRAADGWLLHTFYGLNTVHDVGISADSKVMLVLRGQTLQSFDIETGAPLKETLLELPDTFYISSAAFTPDGSLLAVRGDNYLPRPSGRVQIWRVADGQRLRSHAVPAYDGYKLLFSPGGHRLALVTSRRIKMWRMSDGKLLGDFVHGADDGISCLTFGADGNILWTGDNEGGGRIRKWQIGSSRPIRTIATTNAPSELVLVGSRLISASRDSGAFQIWNARTGALRGTFAVETPEVSAFAFSKSAQLLAWGRDDATLVVADVSAWRTNSPPAR